ncbi:MAG: tetratricopeptide repeat protein, partial [Proteobacteria bacterium]|nr:tetratricopeptide repeat protein [Pseudomonadota bacterium]
MRAIIAVAAPTLLAAALTVGVSPPAWSHAVSDCNDAVDAATRIAGCTAIINSGPASDVLATALMNRAIGFAESGDLKSALKDLDFALDADPDLLAAHYNRGNVKLDLGRAADAISDFDVVIEQMPSFPLAWLNRGLARERTGNIDGARSDYSRALALDRTLAGARKGLARLGPSTDEDASGADNEEPKRRSDRIPQEKARPRPAPVP